MARQIKKCRQCKRRNPVGHLYCFACGTKFNSGDKPKAPKGGILKECPKCAAALESFDGFCYKCGLRQEDVDVLTEVYEDPETARIYSYRWLQRAKWLCLALFLGGLPIGLGIALGWFSDRVAGAFLWTIATAILSWEIFLYSFNYHLMIRLKPASERMYDFHRIMAPFIRLFGPAVKQLTDSLNFLVGKMSSKDFEAEMKKHEETEASLKERIKALENEVRMKGEGVKVIRPPPRREKEEG